MPFGFSRSIKIGRIAGITIELDYSWFIIFFLVAGSLALGYFPQLYGFGLPLSVALGVGSAILFFVSVLLHELAHSIVANRSGVRIKKITLFVFGGVASLEDEPSTPGVEFKIAIVGPLTSLVLSAFFFGLAYVVGALSLEVAVALEYLSIINLAVGLFNLVPGYPLDGGRLLRAIIWRWSTLERATKIAARAGMVVGYLLVAYGIVLFVITGNLFNVVWLGLIGFFLVTAAKNSLLQTLALAALQKVKVRELLDPQPVVVSDKQDLQTFIKRVLVGRKRMSALVSDGKSITGEITLEQVRRQPIDVLDKKTIGEVMRPISRDMWLRPRMSARAALQRLGSGHTQLPVYERANRGQPEHLIGAVSAESIQIYLAVSTDLLNRSPSTRVSI